MVLTARAPEPEVPGGSLCGPSRTQNAQKAGNSHEVYPRGRHASGGADQAPPQSVYGPLSPHCPLAGTLGVLCPVTRKCSAGQEMLIRGLALGAGGPMRLCAVKAQ